MLTISLEYATHPDAAALAQISQRAFASDLLCGAPGDGGPPGYDSPAWQASALQSATYFKILVEGEIAGGAIVYAQGQGRYYLGRVFLDPAMHRQGIGLAVMQLIFAHFPDACRWTLETPPWNTRTRHFYQRLGFQIVKETEEDLYFEKVMA